MGTGRGKSDFHGDRSDDLGGAGFAQEGVVLNPRHPGRSAGVHLAANSAVRGSDFMQAAKWTPALWPG
ncbi:hypothetical protein SPHINGOAX6_40198 [Sphingomonas sp. AX6]|nr:hypothetical protein SPHINGOAX6_40198 [Sphingomonas sp. AX6]